MTNLDFRCGVFPVVMSSSIAGSSDATDMLDVIVSVSDDRTARVFHVSSAALLSS